MIKSDTHNKKFFSLSEFEKEGYEVIVLPMARFQQIEKIGQHMFDIHAELVPGGENLSLFLGFWRTDKYGEIEGVENDMPFATIRSIIDEYHKLLESCQRLIDKEFHDYIEITWSPAGDKRDRVFKKLLKRELEKNTRIVFKNSKLS